MEDRAIKIQVRRILAGALVTGIAAAALLLGASHRPKSFPARTASLAAASSPARSSAPAASVELDPAFAYYRDRSDESIAEEVAAHGYTCVRYEVTVDGAIRRSLIDAFHRHGLTVWYVTFLDGVYAETGLPPGWQAWKMVTRSDLTGHPVRDGFDRLCLNNPDYLAWKKAKIVSTLHAYPFDGIDLKEPYWPDYPGPDGPTYACFCPATRNAFLKSAFLKTIPGTHDPPNILDPHSPDAPGKNPALWRAWNDFRRDSLIAFLNAIVNGQGGIRQTCPGVKVAAWSLALSGLDGMRHVRDDNGEDEVTLVKTLRPDALCLETHWPDWNRPGLAPEYVFGDKPYLDALRSAGLTLPVYLEADTGSNKDTRRSDAWLAAFERHCAAAGFSPPALYEYSIRGASYTDPPRVLLARCAPRSVRLVFSKRLDADSAMQLSHYLASPGHVAAAQVDGATVVLSLTGLAAGASYHLTVRNLRDTPSLLIYPGHLALRSLPQTLSLANAPLTYSS